MPPSQGGCEAYTDANPRVHSGCTVQVRTEGLLASSGPGGPILDPLMSFVDLIDISGCQPLAGLGMFDTPRPLFLPNYWNILELFCSRHFFMWIFEF